MLSELFKIRMEDVHKSFVHNGGILEVLKGINLTARPGEFVAILGPSGCGKSTIFNILSGLVRPDHGVLSLDGRIVHDGAGLVGYMQQKDLLFPWRTVLDNVLLGPELEGKRHMAQGEAQQLLARFGLGGFANAYPAQLSGGMRQRAALVRTLLLKKDLLLLDEPFGALDAMTRSVMHELVLHAWGEFGLTVLFVTHDVEEALLVASRIYVLTARPAKVKEEVLVPLERPRRVTDQEFVAFKGTLLTLLRGEMAGAFAK